MRKRRSAGLAGLLAMVGTVVVAMPLTPAAAAPVICEPAGTTSILDGTYVVQNNVRAGTAQCVDVDPDGGFTVTESEHATRPGRAPAAYPSIYNGCDNDACTDLTLLPIRYREIGSSVGTISLTYPDSGVWSADVNLEVDPAPRTDGQSGLRVLLRLNSRGPVQPIGEQVGTFAADGVTWQVWYGEADRSVVTFVSPAAISSHSLNLRFYLLDVVRRGYAAESWYLNSIQAGFQIWRGGAGLAVDSFAAPVYHVGSHPPPPIPVPPPTPPQPPIPPPVPGACTATAEIQSEWPHFYVMQVTVTNTSGATVRDWVTSFTLPAGQQIQNAWGTIAAPRTGEVTARALWFNATLQPGQSMTYGFVADRPVGSGVPTGFVCAAG